MDFHFKGHVVSEIFNIFNLDCCITTFISHKIIAKHHILNMFHKKLQMYIWYLILKSVLTGIKENFFFLIAKINVMSWDSSSNFILLHFYTDDFSILKTTCLWNSQYFEFSFLYYEFYISQNNYCVSYVEHDP